MQGPLASNRKLTGQTIGQWVTPEDLDSLSKDQIIKDAVGSNALKMKTNEVYLLGLDKTFKFDPRDKDLVQELILRELLVNLDEKFNGEYPASDVVDQLLEAIKDALENNLKWLFIQLVKPVMKIAAALDPLPEYKETASVLDDDKPMKYIDQAMDNWGSTLGNEKSVRIFYPETRYILDLCCSGSPPAAEYA